MRSLSFAAAFVVAAATIPALAQTAGKPIRVRGEIQSIAGDMVTVLSREGRTVPVTLGDKTSLSVVVTVSRDEIKPGAYLGIASQPQKEGPQKAIEVLVFPEAARGNGEGQRPWDLTPESTMTNATMADTVQSVDGSVVTMRYKDGETKILIGRDTPIVTTRPGSRADLKPGAAVVVFGQTTETGVAAGGMVIEKDGVKPPM